MAAQKWTLKFRELAEGASLVEAKPPKSRRTLKGGESPRYVQAYVQATGMQERAQKLMSYSGDDVQYMEAVIEEEHMANAKSKTSDKLNTDQIAKLFDLDTYEDLNERNIDYIAEQGHYAYKAAIEDGASEEEADEANMKGQEEADGELFRQWHDGVMAAAEDLFGKHGLTLVPVGKQGSAAYPYEYKVVPEESWDKAVVAIIETINGVGDYHFSSVREFLDSGPYTARSGVLEHLGYIASYPEVYGDTSARRIYEGHFR